MDLQPTPTPKQQQGGIWNQRGKRTPNHVQLYSMVPDTPELLLRMGSPIKTMPPRGRNSHRRRRNRRLQQQQQQQRQQGTLQEQIEETWKKWLGENGEHIKAWGATSWDEAAEC